MEEKNRTSRNIVTNIPIKREIKIIFPISKSNSKKSKSILNNLTEKPNPKGGDVVIVLFYVDWCPHCVSTKPEWNKLVNKMNNQKVNGNNVNVVACNAEGSTAEKEATNTQTKTTQHNIISIRIRI